MSQLGPERPAVIRMLLLSVLTLIAVAVNMAITLKMASQAAWFKGAHGGVMQVFSKKNGKKLAEKKLDYLPAFDGLVAASGKLYMATECGSIVCYE